MKNKLKTLLFRFFGRGISSVIYTELTNAIHMLIVEAFVQYNLEEREVGFLEWMEEWE